jgi:DNA transformation protein and related proteins
MLGTASRHSNARKIEGCRPTIGEASHITSFKTFILEQLGRSVPGIRARSMFGGVGIYSGAFFFALIDDDTLYFKVDESNRPDFVARGMEAFQPYGEDGQTMGYYRVPEDLLDDAEALGQWAEKAIAVATRRSRRPGL